MKLEVGQRYRVIHAGAGSVFNIGQQDQYFNVVRVNEMFLARFDNPVADYLKFEQGRRYWYIYAESLDDTVRIVRDTKLARKMNPEYTVVGDWLEI